MTDRGQPTPDPMETRYQPDPMLRRGRSGQGWRWIVAAMIALALVLTFFAISGPKHQVASQQHASRFTTGAGDKPPHTALPTGRGNAHAAPTGEQTKIQ